MKPEKMSVPTMEQDISSGESGLSDKRVGKKVLDIYNGEEKNEFEWIPEGFLTIAGLAKRLGVSEGAILGKMNRLNIEKTKYRISERRVATCLSPEQIDSICNSLSDYISAEASPDGFMTATSLAKELGVDPTTIYKKIDELQIKTEKFRSKVGVSDFLSSDQIGVIRNSLEDLLSAGEAPEGYLTIRKMSNELGVAQKTIMERINGLNIIPKRYRNNIGHLDNYYSPDQIEVIRNSLEDLLSTGKAPEGYLTIAELSRELGTDPKTIRKKVNSLHLVASKYRSKIGLIDYYSPEQVEVIRNSLEDLLSIEEAPEGYLTAKSFARELGVDRMTVVKKIKELKINGYDYKDKTVKRVCSFFSPEQQEQIREALEHCSTGSSIPENAVAFYLDRAGQSFVQGFRPDWLKNPESGRNLELDIFVNPPGVGIEYDGARWHQDVERDMRKEELAKKSGIKIIHIREDGCPELPNDSVCIYGVGSRTGNKGLADAIKKCFEILNISEPDVDINRDKDSIMAFMRQRIIKKLDSARTFEELSVAS